mmetsp:Transcript_21205/g.48680  ORF Transcript_21205/g.48680 Transcript_21205/m.48680 type:complete len:290 (+) Transcript_21205:610-1479(+)
MWEDDIRQLLANVRRVASSCLPSPNDLSLKLGAILLSLRAPIEIDSCHESCVVPSAKVNLGAATPVYLLYVRRQSSVRLMKVIQESSLCCGLNVASMHGFLPLCHSHPCAHIPAMQTKCQDCLPHVDGEPSIPSISSYALPTLLSVAQVSDFLRHLLTHPSEFAIHAGVSRHTPPADQHQLHNAEVPFGLLIVSHISHVLYAIPSVQEVHLIKLLLVPSAIYHPHGFKPKSEVLPEQSYMDILPQVQRPHLCSAGQRIQHHVYLAPVPHLQDVHLDSKVPLAAPGIVEH